MGGIENGRSDRKLLADAARFCRRYRTVSVAPLLLLYVVAPLLAERLPPLHADEDTRALFMLAVFGAAAVVASGVAGLAAGASRKRVRELLLLFLRRRGWVRRATLARAVHDRSVQQFLLATLDALVDEGRVLHSGRGYAVAGDAPAAG